MLAIEEPMPLEKFIKPINVMDNRGKNGENKGTT